LNPDAAANILTRHLIKVREGGADIDGKRIRVFARELGDTYAEFEVTCGLGNNTAAIFTQQDLNNQTAEGVISGWSDVTNTEGYQLIDLNNGEGDQPYYSQWDKASRTLNQLYERTKWLTRRGTSSTLHTMDGELFRGITHEIDWTGQTAADTFDEDETLSWGSGSTAGTGIILADSEAGVDAGQTGTSWIQLLTGVAPTAAMVITGGTSTATAACSVITSRTVSAQFLGVSTGTSIIGAYGIGIDPNDLSSSDILFDLNNVQRNPPNNVDFNVYGLAVGEDYLIVTNASGSGIDYGQYIVSATLAGASHTYVSTTATIASDTPNTGTIRIELDVGTYRKITYTSWSGKDFYFTATSFSDPDDASNNNRLFISYLDKLAATATETVTIKYSSPRTLFVRVRDGGGSPIKTFETTAALGSGGGSATAIRTSDA
jgi:hypothetical protein